jgi:hypothetical protein
LLLCGGWDRDQAFCHEVLTCKGRMVRLEQEKLKPVSLVPVNQATEKARNEGNP